MSRPRSLVTWVTFAETGGGAAGFLGRVARRATAARTPSASTAAAMPARRTRRAGAGAGGSAAARTSAMNR